MMLSQPGEVLVDTRFKMPQVVIRRQDHRRKGDSHLASPRKKKSVKKIITVGSRKDKLVHNTFLIHTCCNIVFRVRAAEVQVRPSAAAPARPAHAPALRRARAEPAVHKPRDQLPRLYVRRYCVST